MKKLAIGADIGGSHITCQVFDIENQISYENTLIRKSVDSHGLKDEIIASWSEAILKTAESVGLNNLAGIGFAMPGPFDYPNGIAWFNADVQKFENLHGVDVKSELINHLGLSPDFSIRFLNDASCFAIGEAWLGEAANYKRIIAITLEPVLELPSLKTNFQWPESMESRKMVFCTTFLFSIQLPTTIFPRAGF
jgi:glucokinase